MKTIFTFTDFFECQILVNFEEKRFLTEKEFMELLKISLETDIKYNDSLKNEEIMDKMNEEIIERFKEKFNFIPSYKESKNYLYNFVFKDTEWYNPKNNEKLSKEEYIKMLKIINFYNIKHEKEINNLMENADKMNEKTFDKKLRIFLDELSISFKKELGFIPFYYL